LRVDIAKPARSRQALWPALPSSRTVLQSRMGKPSRRKRRHWALRKKRGRAGRCATMVATASVRAASAGRGWGQI